MIELKNVTKTYAEGNYSLMDVNLQIQKGEFVFIVGGSGAGKTTLLQLLIAEDKPSEGTIVVANQRLDTIKRRQIPQYRRKIGIVFRDFRLFTDKTVYENVAFALRVTGEPSGSIRTKVMASLQMVELADKVKCYPGDLTGCEQQRVALARALAGGPNVIIADEPCGNIDPVESRDLMELFGRIQSRYEKTVVVLTHDRELAESFGHRIVRLRRGEIVEDRAAYVHGDLGDFSTDQEAMPPEDESLPLSVPDRAEEAELPPVMPVNEMPIVPIVLPVADESTESTDTVETTAPAEATEATEPVVPVEAEESVCATGDTVEYDLLALVTAGEMDSHTANDLMIAAMQLLDLPIPSASAQEEQENAPADSTADEDGQTIVLPVQTVEAAETQAAGEDVDQTANAADDSPTVVIDVVPPEASNDCPTVVIPAITTEETVESPTVVIPTITSDDVSAKEEN
jgi:cell division transport system ATP-binding protein